VVLTARAQRDLEAAHRHIATTAPETAASWYRNFLYSLLRLEENPEIWPEAPETARFSFVLRQLLFRTKSRYANRALFTIVGSEVRVLAIRRPGQPLINKADIE
jgi:plasmid stabilization system protein ParE